MPLLGDTRLPAVEKALGLYPALFSQDFGFSAAGTWDGINYRQRIVDDAIRLHAHGIWMQLGVIDLAAAARARAAGITVVMDRCPVIEDRRLRLFAH